VVAKQSQREGEREGFWREKLARWRESGGSQAAFCRENGLDANSFSSWKKVLAERDRVVKSRSGTKVGALMGSQKTNDSDAGAPAFVRYAITECQSAEGAEKPPSNAKQTVHAVTRVAAELVDANSGRRLRIFNGADQVTVTALLSALSQLGI
jgi:hypothetical protein